jgi:hypothetical protein
VWAAATPPRRFVPAIARADTRRRRGRSLLSNAPNRKGPGIVAGALY